MSSLEQASSTRQYFVLGMTACFLPWILGCEPSVEYVPVKGKVLINGEPLTQGSIRFVPDNGRPALGQITEDGSFQIVSPAIGSGGENIEGVVPGRYRISVKASELTSEAEDAEVRWLTPPRYADTRTSGLLADIKEPTEDLVLKLTSAESADATEGMQEDAGKNE